MTNRRRETTPKQRPTGNTLNAQAKPYIDRIEALEAEKKVVMEGFAEDLTLVYEQAEREALVSKKALQGVVKLRKQLRDNAAAREKMGDEDRSQFDVLANAFVDADPEFSSLLRTMAENGATVTVTTATSELTAQHHTDEIDRAFG